MGITKPTVELYTELIRKNALPLSGSVIELGAQDVHFCDRTTFEDLFDAAGIDKQPIDEFFHGMPGRRLYQALGYEYFCIDLNGDPSTLQWDLNSVVCPPEFRGRFSLVTNHGTTEHLIGQPNAFRLMHDMTRVGGLIFLVLPIDVYNHGLINYNPIFVELLAAANSYEVVCLYTSNLHQGLMPYRSEDERSSGYVVAALRKRSSLSFAMPLQTVAPVGVWGRPSSVDVIPAMVPAIVGHLASEGSISRVIDIGAGTGALKRALGPILPSAEFVAVEAWAPTVAEFDLTATYDEVIVSDARWLNFSKLGHFSVAILDDILGAMTHEDAVRLGSELVTVADYLIVMHRIANRPAPLSWANPFEATTVRIEMVGPDLGLTFIREDHVRREEDYQICFCARPDLEAILASALARESQGLPDHGSPPTAMIRWWVRSSLKLLRQFWHTMAR